MIVSTEGYCSQKKKSITPSLSLQEERFKVLSEMCVDLCRENYHESDKIRAREREIIERSGANNFHLSMIIA